MGAKSPHGILGHRDERRPGERVQRALRDHALSSERCKVRWTLAPSYAGWVCKIEPVLKRGPPIAQKRLLKTLERVARERSART
jgi:hypothetical protein